MGLFQLKIIDIKQKIWYNLSIMKLYYTLGFIYVAVVATLAIVFNLEDPETMDVSRHVNSLDTMCEVNIKKEIDELRN